MQALNNFTNTTLSAFYFDISKDRLYADGVDDIGRRSAQTVLYHVLINYTTALAPVVPHLAEEVWEFFEPVRSQFGKDSFSVFLEQWDQTSSSWNNPDLAEEWTALRKIRGLANKAIEAARQEKVIGSSLEAELDIYLPLDSRLGVLLKSHEDELKLLCITSRAEVHLGVPHGSPPDGYSQTEAVSAFGVDTSVSVVCRRSPLHKCPRCWNFHSDKADTLCRRCDITVAGLA
ncbi:isoleucine-tRNA ligase [Coemansia sp. RSA 2603]|nr:isoleucine-tRNA ligase [Coemansia sp. RSA 2603]